MESYSYLSFSVWPISLGIMFSRFILVQQSELHSFLWPSYTPLNGETIIYLSSPPSVDTCVGPTFWLSWIRLQWTLIYKCLFKFLLDWPKSSFGISHKVVQKNPNKLFGQPNTFSPPKNGTVRPCRSSVLAFWTTVDVFLESSCSSVILSCRLSSGVCLPQIPLQFLLSPGFCFPRLSTLPTTSLPPGWLRDTLLLRHPLAVHIAPTLTTHPPDPFHLIVWGRMGL